MVNKSKSKLAIVSLLLGSIALGIWGWRVFTGTPRYSLGQLKTAISRNEPNEIKKYFDVEAIASQMVDFTLNSAQQQAIENNDIFGILGNSLGLAEMFRPQLQQGMEQMFEEALTQISTDELQDLKLTSIKSNESEAIAKRTRRVIATFEARKRAFARRMFHSLVELEPSSDGEDFLESISLLLEQQPDRRWKIIGLGEGTLEAVSESINE